MVMPEFMRFYSYTASEALYEYAQTFFSLLNSMYRLQAKESMRDITNASAAFSGEKSVIKELEKQERGKHGLVQEVRVVKEVRRG